VGGAIKQRIQPDTELGFTGLSRFRTRHRTGYDWQ